jgi:hypothetical protein
MGNGPSSWYADIMGTSREIDVTNLDATHRRVLEEVIGTDLRANQRLLISVREIPDTEASIRRAQSLDEWTKVYEGLSDEQIETIDRDVNQRANLTRNVP